MKASPFTRKPLCCWKVTPSWFMKTLDKEYFFPNSREHSCSAGVLNTWLLMFQHSEAALKFFQHLQVQVVRTLAQTTGMGSLSPSNLNHVQVWHLNVPENRLTSLLMQMLSTATHALRNLSDDQVFYGIKHCILPRAERSLCSRLARNRAVGTCPPTWIGRCGESTVAEISGFCSKGYPVCFDLLTQWVACVPVK